MPREIGRRRRSADTVEELSKEEKLVEKKRRSIKERACKKPLDDGQTSDCENISIKKRLVSFSPATLATKLDEMRTDLLKENMDNPSAVDVTGLNMQADTGEEYRRKRESIMKLINDPSHFDEDGKTELNYDAAAIAGAKLVIDSQRASRSMSKKLMADCGIGEEEILYKPLSYAGKSGDAAREQKRSRQASVVESLVDFQKQIQFKLNVLKFVADKQGDDLSKSAVSDIRATRKARNEEALKKRIQEENKRKNETKEKRTKRLNAEAALLKTPSFNRTIDPLDDQRIIEEYALEVASEVREVSKNRRRIAPIPFNIDFVEDMCFEV